MPRAHCGSGTLKIQSISTETIHFFNSWYINVQEMFSPDVFKCPLCSDQPDTGWGGTGDRMAVGSKEYAVIRCPE